MNKEIVDNGKCSEKVKQCEVREIGGGVTLD